jgi:hypothetical protein
MALPVAQTPLKPTLKTPADAVCFSPRFGSTRIDPALFGAPQGLPLVAPEVVDFLTRLAEADDPQAVCDPKDYLYGVLGSSAGILCPEDALDHLRKSVEKIKAVAKGGSVNGTWLVHQMLEPQERSIRMFTGLIVAHALSLSPDEKQRKAWFVHLLTNYNRMEDEVVGMFLPTFDEKTRTRILTNDVSEESRLAILKASFDKINRFGSPLTRWNILKQSTQFPDVVTDNYYADVLLTEYPQWYGKYKTAVETLVTDPTEVAMLSDYCMDQCIRAAVLGTLESAQAAHDFDMGDDELSDFFVKMPELIQAVKHPVIRNELIAAAQGLQGERVRDMIVPQLPKRSRLASYPGFTQPWTSDAIRGIESRFEILDAQIRRGEMN